MKNKITIEDLTTPIKGKYIPFVELLRSMHVNVGEAGRRKYKNWIIEHDNKSHFTISNKSYHTKTYSLFDENGDINVYDEDEDDDLVTTDNQANLFRMYKLLGIDLPMSKEDRRVLSLIENLNNE